LILRYLRCRPVYLNRSYRCRESQRKNYLGSTGKNWLNVYVGNLIGRLLFVLLMWLSGEYMTANGNGDLTFCKPPTTKCTILLLKPCAWYPGKPDGLSGG
jgi:hypothetical protein